MRIFLRARKNRIFLFSLSAILMLVSCSQNALLESAKRDTDAALLFEAKKKMNSSLWTDAITMIGRMSAAGQAERATKVTLASAYAGRCGLDLIRLADQISNSAGTNFFSLLGSSMRAATAPSVTDCIAAETTLLAISSDPTALTADENMMLSFIGFSKIGAILAAYADLDDDGSADAGFDACDTADIPEAMVRQFGTGITLAIASLNASGSSIASDLGTAVTTACTTLAGVNPAYDFCAITDPADFTADQIKALGGLIHSTDNPGVGTCAGDLATCVCP
ncbi:MAG: hypothetical protein J0L82_06560 [Deltaproteobacteria bacterium]|nr:hypothetical protein [Deltaproteobacteria bacterium]